MKRYGCNAGIYVSCDQGEGLCCINCEYEACPRLCSKSKRDEQCIYAEEICDMPEDLDENDLGRQCRICGCTWLNACPGGCWWVEEDLCSQCAEKMKAEISIKELSANPPFKRDVGAVHVLISDKRLKDEIFKKSWLKG